MEWDIADMRFLAIKADGYKDKTMNSESGIQRPVPWSFIILRVREHAAWVVLSGQKIGNHSLLLQKLVESDLELGPTKLP